MLCGKPNFFAYLAATSWSGSQMPTSSGFLRCGREVRKPSAWPWTRPITATLIGVGWGWAVAGLGAITGKAIKNRLLNQKAKRVKARDIRTGVPPDARFYSAALGRPRVFVDTFDSRPMLFANNRPTKKQKCKFNKTKTNRRMLVSFPVGRQSRWGTRKKQDCYWMALVAFISRT